MTQSFRVAVADDEPDMLDYFRETLAELGHNVVCAARTGRDLVQACRAEHPNLVITDIKMPDMDGIEAAHLLSREEPMPVILVSGYHDSELLERAQAEHVLAYLVKPIKQADLETAIAIVTRRFENFQTLRKETASLRQAIEDRKVIERAKGILMKRAGLDEQPAFRRLQKLASEKNRRLVEMAQAVLTAEEAFRHADDD